MTTVLTEQSPFLAGYETFDRSRSGHEPAAVGELRRRAIERFRELGFPTLRQEDWRFTNVAPIAKGDFHLATANGSPAHATAEELEPWLFRSAGSHLVFVDGRLSTEHSDLSGLPEGTILTGLGRAMEEHPELVEEHLARHAAFGEHPFVALNTGYMAEGAFLYLPKGAVVEEPIHVLHYSTGTLSSDGDGEGRPAMIFPRNLVVLGEASQATVVETYGSPEGARYFNCPVTEIVCGPNAVLDHYKMQQESTDAFHMATFQLHQERSSSYALHSLSLGGALVRNDVNTKLDGEGCESILNGFYMVRGQQFVDHHMRVVHAAPHCHSFELFKGILEDRSRAVFNGLIHVHPGAQKTDAKQSSQNLLLSDEALVNSNPQLLIFADDVKCTHGSTVGQLDDDAVFYLRSRGIGLEASRSLLIWAFASDIVSRIKVPELRQDLEEFLFTRLPKGEVVREAV